MKPIHLCNYPGCSKLIPYDQRYCSKHEYHKPIDQADKQERHMINKAVYHKRITSQHEGQYQIFYRSTQWRKLSHRWLMMHPLCVSCEAHGIYRKGDLVDHIVELRDDWSKRLDPDNLQTLCYACHNRKTWKEKHKRMAKTRTKINYENHRSLITPGPMLARGERGRDFRFNKGPICLVFHYFHV